MRPVKMILAMAVALMLSSGADAANYYISPTGSDSNAGTFEKPWKTFKNKQTKLQPGDTLFARGGVYSKCSAGCYKDWSYSGTAGARITFKNAPGETAIFDGGMGTSGAQGYFLYLDGESHLQIEGLHIRNWGASSGEGMIQLQNKSNDIVIKRVKFYGNGNRDWDHHIYLAGHGAGAPYNIDIVENDFGSIFGAAVHCFHAPCGTNVRVRNNYFHGNDGQTIGESYACIVIRDAAADWLITGNTLRNCHPDIARQTVRNIVFANNNNVCTGGRLCLEVWDFQASQLKVLNNNWWAGVGKSPKFSGTPRPAGANLFVDPQFATTGTASPAIKSTSMLVDKGLATYCTGSDFFGTPRPLGAACDMGAHEVR